MNIITVAVIIFRDVWRAILMTLKYTSYQNLLLNYNKHPPKIKGIISIRKVKTDFSHRPMSSESDANNLVLNRRYVWNTI